MANARRINHIGRLRWSGRILVTLADIKEEVATLNENLYRRENLVHPKLDGLSFPPLTMVDQTWVERDFEEEVETMLNDYGSDKAPGPDDFNFCFIKAGSDFLKKDFIKMLTKFHHRGSVTPRPHRT